MWVINIDWKPIETLKNELLYYISTYKSISIHFLDSDFIGEDIDRLIDYWIALLRLELLSPNLKLLQ